MKNISIAIGLAVMILLPAAALAASADAQIDPCLGCHDTATPDIVSQWQESKHSAVGVKCYVCHHAKEGDAKGVEHNGFRVTTAVTPATCESCHPRQTQEIRESGHHRPESGSFAVTAGTRSDPGVGPAKPDGAAATCATCHRGHVFDRERAGRG